MFARSYLFVPGDRADMLAKAGERGADAVIADLEDAVAPASRHRAREVVAEWLGGLGAPDFAAWVRVNSGSQLDDDLEIIAAPALTGVMVPKVTGPEELHGLAARLTRIEAGAGMPEGRIRLLPIIETAQAMRAIDRIAIAPRVQQLMIGELDLGAAIGADPADAEPFVPLRMEVVVASAAAGIDPPLGPVSPDYRDLDALAADTARLARQGFGARPAIHPAQIPVINAAFTPTADAVARARRLISLYDAALAEGRGAVTDEDGRMVDEAVVQVARRLVGTAGVGE